MARDLSGNVLLSPKLLCPLLSLSSFFHLIILRIKQIRIHLSVQEINSKLLTICYGVLLLSSSVITPLILVTYICQEPGWKRTENLFCGSHLSFFQSDKEFRMVSHSFSGHLYLTFIKSFQILNMVSW